MQKLRFIISVFVIACIGFGVSYGNDVHQTDGKIIEKAMLELKKEQAFRDRAILNINKLVKAQWPSNVACICMLIVLLDDKGELEEDTEVKFIDLLFDGPPDYDFYGDGGPKSRIVEKFMTQINKKRSKRIPLINFIQKDLIVTLEFADGDKVIFDGYYNSIKENLAYWYRKFNTTLNQ
ncbi:MAG: hypothetical protein LBB56_06755 [Chitinispirillales bacterium]|nr:hypothetical protein [Chitinispirillales bacterium]